MSLPKHHFECHLLLFHATTNHFLIGFWCVMKNGFYMTTGKAVKDQLNGWTQRSSKALPKAKLAPKKGHGQCLVVCCPSDPLQLSESQQNHYLWEVCSVNWWDALTTSLSATSNRKSPICSMTMPDCTSQNQCFKSWMNGAMEFCLICYIHLTSRQPISTFSSILTTFCRENASTTSGRQKMLSKSLSNPKSQIFTL